MNWYYDAPESNTNWNWNGQFTDTSIVLWTHSDPGGFGSHVCIRIIERRGRREGYRETSRLLLD